MEQEISAQMAEQPPQDDVVTKARTTFSKAVLNLGIFSGLTMALQFLLSILAGRLFPNLEGAAAANANYLLSFLPMYLIAFPVYLLLSRKSETAPPQKSKLSIGWFFGYLMIGKALSQVGIYISSILTAIAAKLFSTNIEDTTLSDAIMGENPGLLLFFAVLCAPIVEELLCRKVFIDRVRKYGDGKAIVMSGVLFGLIHGNFTQVFYAGALGVLLAFVYVKTGRVIYTILLHMAFNFLGSAAPLLLHVDKLMNLLSQEADMTSLKSGDLLPVGIYILINGTLVVVGAVLLIVEIAKGTRFRLDEPITAVPKGKHFAVSCLHIGMAVFLVITIATFVMSVM